MPDLSSLLPILRCPWCRSGFEFDERPRPALGRAEFGLLRCTCDTYPVIDGIPIIQRGPVCMLEHTHATRDTEGIAIDALVALLRRGATLDALLECIAVPELPKWCLAMLGWRISHSKFVAAVARLRGKQKFLRRVLSQRDVIGAREILEFYYLSGGPLGDGLGHYFIRRFGQPRHLAALSLATTFASEAKPILDIACGIGHLEHYFGSRNDPAPVVGLDMNFYHLWIARHWMAPAAHYVCANAADALPFADGAFAATLCSDAYHYIPNHENLLREIERCAPGGMVVLTRVGNASVMPNEGVERSLERYVEELGADVRIFDEAGLVECYLRRADVFSPGSFSSSPFSSRHGPDALRSKWLSFAWNLPTLGARTIAADVVAPHAAGRIDFNPIYEIATRPDLSLRLTFRFPTVWYAYENHAMLAFHPRVVTVSADQLAGMQRGEFDSSLRALVDSFVLMGMPEKFSRGRPARAFVRVVN